MLFRESQEDLDILVQLEQKEKRYFIFLFMVKVCEGFATPLHCVLEFFLKSAKV